MEAFLRSNGVTGILGISAALAPVWYGCDWLLCRYVYHPIGLACGLTDSWSERFPPWFGTGIYHSVEFVNWLMFGLVVENSWCWEWNKWDVHLRARVTEAELAERDSYSKLYVLYFSYCLFSWFKDMLKKGKSAKAKGKNAIIEMMFTMHHWIAILLTASSIVYGCWRAGFLTRLIHCPADVFLYFGKCYQGRWSSGNGSKLVLAVIFVVIFVSWVATRVVVYGYLIYALGVMWNRERQNWPMDLFICASLQWLGSFIMWVLQVVWSGGILQAMIPFLKSDSYEDPWHDNVKAQGSKDKKKDK